MNAQPEQRADQERVSRDTSDVEFPPAISQWQIAGVERDLTPLQYHYLSLLQRLIALKDSYQEDPNAEEWLAVAISKAIFSTLRDSIEANVGDEAKDLLNPQQRVS